MSGLIDQKDKACQDKISRLPASQALILNVQISFMLINVKYD